MIKLIFGVVLLLCGCNARAQHVKLLSFTQNQLPCDSLDVDDWTNTIVDSTHQNGFFIVTILALGYCDTNHYGSIKLDQGVLNLAFSHPDFPPNAGYISLNYIDKMKKLIEVTECLCFYRMNYKINLNGQTVEEITIKGRW
jgi:hypothetical protein